MNLLYVIPVILVLTVPVYAQQMAMPQAEPPADLVQEIKELDYKWKLSTPDITESDIDEINKKVDDILEEYKDVYSDVELRIQQIKTEYNITNPMITQEDYNEYVSKTQQLNIQLDIETDEQKISDIKDQLVQLDIEYGFLPNDLTDKELETLLVQLDELSVEIEKIDKIINDHIISLYAEYDIRPLFALTQQEIDDYNAEYAAIVSKYDPINTTLICDIFTQDNIQNEINDIIKEIVRNYDDTITIPNSTVDLEGMSCRDITIYIANTSIKLIDENIDNTGISDEEISDDVSIPGMTMTQDPKKEIADLFRVYGFPLYTQSSSSYQPFIAFLDVLGNNNISPNIKDRAYFQLANIFIPQVQQNCQCLTELLNETQIKSFDKELTILLDKYDIDKLSDVYVSLR